MSVPVPAELEPDPRAVGLSWIRTTVPYLWGYLLTWLATRWPWAADLLDGALVQSAVVAAAGSLWYLLFRWLESRLPAAVIRILLGSAATPVYPRLTAPWSSLAPHIPRQAEGR